MEENASKTVIIAARKLFRLVKRNYKEMFHRILIIPILILLATNCSCVKDKVTDQPAGNIPIPPATQSPSNAKKTYLALGDSYTIGHGVPSGERYPAQTKNWLKENGITGIKDPQIIATSGWTTLNLQAAIENQNPEGPFDAVSILIGVNDQYRGADTAGYRTRFTQLVQKCILLGNNLPAHVFVLSIPDYSVTPFGKNFDVKRISKEIDEYNAINKKVALSYKVQYLGITSSTREATTNPALICSDGLHPSGLEYKKWAEKLCPMMKTILE